MGRWKYRSRLGFPEFSGEASAGGGGSSQYMSFREGRRNGDGEGKRRKRGAGWCLSSGKERESHSLCIAPSVAVE